MHHQKSIYLKKSRRLSITDLDAKASDPIHVNNLFANKTIEIHDIEEEKHPDTINGSKDTSGSRKKEHDLFSLQAQIN